MRNETVGATPQSLSELLTYYYEARQGFMQEHGKGYFIRIPLTPDFLRTCEERIIEAHKKYGTDWITKNNIQEIEFEKYDIINYLLLDMCQKKYIASLKRQKLPRRGK